MFTIILHMNRHAVMKLLNHCDELLRVAELGHDLPEILLTDGDKGLCQVHKSGIKADILFMTLLLELPSYENHVHMKDLLGDLSLIPKALEELGKLSNQLWACQLLHRSQEISSLSQAPFH